jgi:hypothetical protein
LFSYSVSLGFASLAIGADAWLSPTFFGYASLRFATPKGYYCDNLFWGYASLATGADTWLSPNVYLAMLRYA